MSTENIETKISKIAQVVEQYAASARAARGEELNDQRRSELLDRARTLLKEQDAVLVAHYYVDGVLQDLALETGGCVSDSLEMARFGVNHPASTVVVAGVRFMGETAKILSPKKRILLVEMEADCSLDIGCPAEDFAAFCDEHPGRTVVVYANTSAAVKARADWAVTSSIAVDLVRHLHEKGEKILWAPDRYLGEYIRAQTGADMLMWHAACIVHEEFKAAMLYDLKKEHPDAKVLVHPESPAQVVDLADVVGSTSQILAAARNLDADTFIVATEDGIFHQMKKELPHKTFITAPTAGRGAECVSCAHCPWMKMNSLERLVNVLENNTNEVFVDEQVRVRAEKALQRMVAFNAQTTA